MLLVRDFSWQRGVNHFGPEGPRIHFSELPHGFAYVTPYQLRRTSNSALTYPPASSLHFTIEHERKHLQKQLLWIGHDRTDIGGCRI